MNQSDRNSRRQAREELMQYYAMMVGVLAAMPESEKAELEAWEKRYVDGSGRYGTSDWPGWEKYIGPTPKHNRTAPVYKKQPIPNDLRWQVWERDNFTCLDCGTRRNLTVDHIEAESKGGKTILENLQTLCRICNSRKGCK